MTAAHEKTVTLGPEYDESLRVTLRDILAHLGGNGLPHDWGVAGSQEVETTCVQVGAERVVIESETYIGLCIRGPAELVDRIRDMVKGAAVDSQ